MIRSLFSGKKKKSRSNTETAPQPGEAPSIGRPVSPNALATQTAGPRSRTGTDTLGGLPPSIPPTLLLSPDALLLTSQITVHNNSGWYGALSSSATSRPLSRQTSFGGSVAIAVLLLNVPPRTISVTASVVQTIAEAREGATTRLRAEDEAARDADEGGDATKDVTPVHSSTTLLQREVAGWRHVAIPAGFSREPVALVYALPDSMSPSSILLAARLYPRAYSSASLSVHADSLSPKAQRVIIRSVASALFALHAAGLAHGSVCSARVVVDPTRTETLGPPVLVDAGMLPLVRATDAAATPPPPVDGVVSLAGKLYEAARWQAPEQLDDPTEVSAAADMYSFGALVYEVLLGEVPWDAFDVRDAVSRVRDGARLFIPDAVAPLLLRALLQRCFDLDGDARVDSAEAVDLLSREDWDVDPVAEAAAAATAEAAEQAARQVEQVAAPFRCDVCGKRYHYDSDLVQHTALRHPEVAAANEEAATSAAAASSSSSSSSSTSTSTNASTTGNVVDFSSPTSPSSLSQGAASAAFQLNTPTRVYCFRPVEEDRALAQRWTRALREAAAAATADRAAAQVSGEFGRESVAGGGGGGGSTISSRSGSRQGWLTLVPGGGRRWCVVRDGVLSLATSPQAKPSHKLPLYRAELSARDAASTSFPANTVGGGGGTLRRRRLMAAMRGSRLGGGGGESSASSTSTTSSPQSADETASPRTSPSSGAPSYTEADKTFQLVTSRHSVVLRAESVEHMHGWLNTLLLAKLRVEEFIDGIPVE